MNYSKTLKLACALALSATPFTASAYTAEKAIEACASALTQDHYAGDVAMRIDEDSDTRDRLNETEIFHLDLRDAATDEVVLRGDCVVNSRARVLRFKSLPLDADDAEKRSLTAN